MTKQCMRRKNKTYFEKFPAGHYELKISCDRLVTWSGGFLCPAFFYCIFRSFHLFLLQLPYVYFLGITVKSLSTDYDILSQINSVVVNMRKVEVHWSIVNKVSSTFTLQYRKTEDSSWKEVAAISGNTTTLKNSIEKYKNYIVRLKSATGIVMLKNYVFGGSYSDTSKFLVKKGRQYFVVFDYRFIRMLLFYTIYMKGLQ